VALWVRGGRKLERVWEGRQRERKGRRESEEWSLWPGAVGRARRRGMKQKVIR